MVTAQRAGTRQQKARQSDMANIICKDCKYHKEVSQGFRTFISCTDTEKEKGYSINNFNYHSNCTNYEKESEVQDD